jgi:hypothetical protein
MADLTTKVWVAATTASLTIEELAQIIIHLDSEQQALLISLMAEHATFSVPMQLDYVSAEPGLTPKGRSLMRLIGDYADPAAGEVQP